MKKNRIIFILISFLALIICVISFIYIKSDKKTENNDKDSIITNNTISIENYVNIFNEFIPCNKDFEFEKNIYRYSDLDKTFIMQIVYNYLTLNTKTIDTVSKKDIKDAILNIFGNVYFDVNNLDSMSNYKLTDMGEYYDLTLDKEICLNSNDAVVNESYLVDSENQEIYYAKLYKLFHLNEKFEVDKTLFYPDDSYSGDGYTEEDILAEVDTLPNVTKFKIVFKDNIFDHIELI